MFKKIFASCCMAALVMSFTACGGPGDIKVSDPGSRTIPGGDNPDPNKENSGVNMSPEG